MFCASNITFKKLDNVVHNENVTESSHLDRFAEIQDTRSIRQIGRDSLLEIMDASNDFTKETFKSMITEEATVLVNEADTKIKNWLDSFTRIVEKIKKAVVDAIRGLIGRITKILGIKKQKDENVTNAEKIIRAYAGGQHPGKGEPETFTPRSSDKSSQGEEPKSSESRSFGNPNENDAWKIAETVLGASDIEEIGRSVEVRLMRHGYEPKDKSHSDSSIKAITKAAVGTLGMQMLDVDVMPNVVRTVANMLGGNNVDATTIDKLFADNSVGGAKASNKMATEKTIGSFLAIKMTEPEMTDDEAIKIANDVSDIEDGVLRVIYDSNIEDSILENGSAKAIFEYGDETDNRFLNYVTTELEGISKKINAYKPAQYVARFINKNHVVSSVNGKELEKNNSTELEFKIMGLCNRVITAYMNAITLSCSHIVSYEIEKKNKAVEFARKIASAVSAKTK